MKKILIVEDDKIVAGIYRNKLQNEGFAVEIAADGDEAICELKKSAFDLVMLDLVLPRTNGIAVLNFIRSNPATVRLPVIVFSNSYLSNLVQEAWKAGANKCLTKADCTPRQLVEIIRETLAQKKEDQVSRDPVPEILRETGNHQSRSDVIPILDARPLTADASSLEAQVRERFQKNVSYFVNDLRARLQTFAKAGAGAASQSDMAEFYRAVHSLTGNAAIAGFHKIAHLSSALEALLKELSEKPHNINASCIRTTAHAIDSLSVLFENAPVTTTQSLPPLVLVLDDEPVSRRTLCLALENAGLRTVNTSDPASALRLLEDNSFDLIFSDVEMPGMRGFEFCAKAREMRRHKTTPLIFVTSLSDFETRAQSKLSGGTDLIGKPFLLVEVAVKALTFLLRGGRA